jgi:hypothetical protein
MRRAPALVGRDERCTKQYRDPMGRYSTQRVQTERVRAL